jgi:hypothetical protein
MSHTNPKSIEGIKLTPYTSMQQFTTSTQETQLESDPCWPIEISGSCAPTGLPVTSQVTVDSELAFHSEVPGMRGSWGNGWGWGAGGDAEDWGAVGWGTWRAQDDADDYWRAAWGWGRMGDSPWWTTSDGAGYETQQDSSASIVAPDSTGLSTWQKVCSVFHHIKLLWL